MSNRLVVRYRMYANWFMPKVHYARNIIIITRYVESMCVKWADCITSQHKIVCESAFVHMHQDHLLWYITVFVVLMCGPKPVRIQSHCAVPIKQYLIYYDYHYIEYVITNSLYVLILPNIRHIMLLGINVNAYVFF